MRAARGGTAVRGDRQQAPDAGRPAGDQAALAGVAP